ncbi:type II toxin-antitoxin system PemK/MazF family toxin [Lentilactobacillus kisonensis]|nr:type II toxin-antitoxin system PemK/MazF family toxin [Lentilactobacillus kisonensis]EHO47568.1 toxin-antitoxin system, toxin component, MazF family [Lentilactobacillus kisonensis F0435]
MKKNDVGLAYVEFDDGSGGKRRPVLIVEDRGSYYATFSITTKFSSKSKRIQSIYFEIHEWAASGLRRPSWIDVGHVVRLEKTIKIQYIGKLQINDAQRFLKFLKEHYPNNIES